MSSHSISVNVFYCQCLCQTEKSQTAKTFKLPSADNCRYEHVPKEHQSRSLSNCTPESTNKKLTSSDFDNIQLDNRPLAFTLLCVTYPPQLPT